MTYPQSDDNTTFTNYFIHGGELMDSLRWSAAVEQFLEAKRLERCSPHTLIDYGNTLRKFTAFLGQDFLLTQILPADIGRFLGSAPELKGKTLRNYHAALSSLWTWAVNAGYLEDNIVRKVKAPKADVVQVQPLEKLEVRALVAAASRTNHPLRDKCILFFLLDTGLRSSELTGLRLGDLEGSQLRVMGKGRKERRVPLSSASMQALNEFLRKDGHTFGPTAAMFPSGRTGDVLGRHALRQLLARLSEISGVENVHPHRFRHTFALNYLRNGGDVYTLQAILGHSTLDMVKRYLAIAQVDVQSAHQQASPVKGWGLG